MTTEKNILITGGAGFIGSHVVRRFVKNYPQYKIINFDKLTYAGNLENLRDIEKASNYFFVKGDICVTEDVNNVFEKFEISHVIHLAAESHVDRSISGPEEFLKTNILGTHYLLEAAKKFWKFPIQNKNLFLHISTDEVFGSISEGFFTENSNYDPRSPYAASKASSDHLVRSYGHTFQIPFVITNCSNNYGPNQFPEKLIPLIINNIKNNKNLPVYGKGENIRDWLYVEDHAHAIDTAFHKGINSETYLIGGNNELTNIELVKKLCEIMDFKLGRSQNSSNELITYVTDRPGHDLRYAINAAKIENELNWKPETSFEKGLEKTVDWYLQNNDWLQNVTSGNYLNYYRKQYKV